MNIKNKFYNNIKHKNYVLMTRTLRRINEAMRQDFEFKGFKMYLFG